jgi:hypothetical protein
MEAWEGRSFFSPQHFQTADLTLWSGDQNAEADDKKAKRPQTSSQNVLVVARFMKSNLTF